MHLVRWRYARHALRMGTVVGAVLVFVSLIGAVTAFADEPVIRGVLSLTQAILVAGGLVAGHLVQAHLDQSDRNPAVMALFGGLGGAITMLLVGVLNVLVASVNLRPVLVNATPELVQILSFGRSVAMGVVLLLVAGVILGSVGSLLSLIPSRWRRMGLYAVAVVLVVGVLRDRGLAIPGAVPLLVAVGAVQYVYPSFQSLVVGRYRRLGSRHVGVSRAGTVGLGLGLLIVLPHLLGRYGTSVIDLVGLYVMMGLGLNIVVGYAGLLDLGYVAFYAIGAYLTGVLTSPNSALGLGLSFWAAWPVAVIGAAFAGVILAVPVLRMRGDYLAIVTLGFGEIIRILVLSDTFKGLLGGAQGIIGIPSPSIGGFTFMKPQELYYLILLGCLVAVVVSLRVSDSRVGRAWVAIREDEDVAEATGVNVVKYKLLAFALGASFSGAGGAIFASWMHAVFPNSFTLLVSINILSLIIVGGLGSVPGVVLGALVLVGLPEVLREFAEFRMLSFGAMLVIMMLARPEGLWPAQRRRRELRSAAEQ